MRKYNPINACKDKVRNIISTCTTWSLKEDVIKQLVLNQSYGIGVFFPITLRNMMEV